MKCYRIYTENKDKNWIEELLSIGFDGFTIIKTDGYWKRTHESGLEIVIYTANTNLIRAMADRIKHHNSQEAVLVTETECEIQLI